MSIPKEPRQLMINLMYLVLTALLALNVSAEILNAFMAMNESIKESSDMVGDANANLVQGIQEKADAYPQFEVYGKKAQEVQAMTKEFEQYIADMQQLLIESSGGYNDKGELKGIKNKDITTRLLVKEGRGEELESKIIELRENLLAVVDSATAQQELSQRLPLNIKPLPPDTDKKNWAQFNFQQMPVAAVLATLSKIQNDSRVSETAILNWISGVVGSEKVMNAYQAMIAADKSYVIRGEELTAEIFLGAYSSTTDNISVSVNGRSVPVNDGKALLRIRPEEIGEKELDVRITEVDPLTAKEKTYRKKFAYEVGERSVAVSADKMNVMYLGVENPFSVSVAGVPSRKVQVQGDNVSLRKTSNGKYIASPKQAGRAFITVSGGGLAPTRFEYRVKRIPDPVIKLGGRKTGGPVPAAEFKAYRGLIPMLEHFDFGARCDVIGFELTYQPDRKDVVSAKNRGASYQRRAQELVNKAKPKDNYFFDHIMVKCPGDTHNRKMESVAFRIR